MGQFAIDRLFFYILNKQRDYLHLSLARVPTIQNRTNPNICLEFKIFFFYKMAAIRLDFGLPNFRSHLKSMPFTNQPLFDNLKSRHVRISDHHCISKTYVLPGCGSPMCGSGIEWEEHRPQKTPPQARQWCLLLSTVNWLVHPKQWGANASGTQGGGRPISSSS